MSRKALTTDSAVVIDQKGRLRWREHRAGMFYRIRIAKPAKTAHNASRDEAEGTPPHPTGKIGS